MAKKFFLTHKTEAGPVTSQIRTIQIFGGKFKILVRLFPGVNSFDFEFCRIFKSLSVLFEPPSDGWHPHRIGLVYIVCADTDGSFQAPPGTRYEPTSIKITGTCLTMKLDQQEQERVLRSFRN